MDLVFLYGPPAAGKLTVARELSRLTGIPVFHNHVTRDLVGELFPDALDEHYGLVNTLRSTVFAYCARHERSLLFTFVYGGAGDDELVADMVRGVEDNGGRVRFVELLAPEEVLLERVVQPGRRTFGKLHDPAVLRDLLAAVPFGSVPYPDVLTIDTSRSEPAAAARAIADHFALNR